MTWILSLFTNIKGWLYAAAAFLFAGVGIYAEVEHKSKIKEHDAAVAHDAQQQAATAQAVVQHIEVRDDVQAQVDKLPTPVPDAQPVATAPADSAAGKLRDDGWTRD